MKSIIIVATEQSNSFVNDIVSKAEALFRHKEFIKNIGAKLCASLFGRDKIVDNDIYTFTEKAMNNLRARVQVCGLYKLDSYMETNPMVNPKQISIHGEVREDFHMLFIFSDRQ